MKLETERLILRTPRRSDWKDIVEGIGDLRVSRNLSHVSYPYGKKDALSWIEKEIKKSRKKERKEYAFVIELKSEKKVVGGSGLHKVDLRKGTAETGSWMARKYWRMGIITEAKIAINDFAFNKLKLRRLVSVAYTDNIASNMMSRKFGLKLEGTLRKDERALSTGKIHDANVFGILKGEWKVSRKKLIREKIK